uniref:Alpha-glucan water dikinase-like N-terminal Ig-like domain-containing protein n=1 Tax=Polytomella parva TaxID=51329 RepID=A0A7S0V7M8_9CHLO|mmetsp:Transcript_29552/g.54236  ORF Transcript_29552/g.54236 Transcript_29552/m.54236 type:complete len:297 (+) Transcript_29552:127-1017(+)|eukprot:CAMPEP_0175049824 /NCGR_PEP_ID=MMETSP0052_2-20121109/6934_1 /TAXON_ID=51329 ORGANISM="Polytomella parva, Strain SAG 63-3" /NCGR_SAMPLE_ID=MMETSP0052_2 /ASSEMBLY_ACC=CAM_ASM_000194 /LENGTH=296 /DNA_ID=CAMNT_0016313991 /DNA_START=66 /DNA_END=956 /DNA_ORIENTATION=+
MLSSVAKLAVQPKKSQKSAIKVNKVTRPNVQAKATVTAWDSWTDYVTAHKSNSAGLAATAAELAMPKDLLSHIKKSKATFKPQFTVSQAGSPVSVSDFKLTQASSIDTANLPKNLRERLEVLSSAQLASALGKTSGLDCANISFTTTEINAALTASGVVVQQGLEKVAYVSFLASETVRQASWSHLEGLVLHWACSEAAGGSWTLPPPGWRASPDKVSDAGGAFQCAFEKQTLTTGDGNQTIYALLLELPLKGSLRSGGTVFVLKATEGQNARWLKDEGNKKDFFIDLSRLPVIKL